MTFGLSKKKSVSSASSSSLVLSIGLHHRLAGNYTTDGHKNAFTKFDEKKDYVRRCLQKPCPALKKCPAAVSFCLGKH